MPTDINDILTEAVKRGSSDLHFSVGNFPIMRINEKLVALDKGELVTKELVNELASIILSVEQKEKLEKEKEIIVTHDFGKNLRFKVNIFHQRGLLSVVLRPIPHQAPTADSLGLSQEIINLADIKQGLVIVSGPFGSGRSTTVAALIERINQTKKKYIITIEDPIEYIFTNKKSIIEQREVGTDANSYKDALKYFEEEDGDILFLEKMSDPKIVPIVLEIAKSGSLVFTSINATSATKTVTSILGGFSTTEQSQIRESLASALKAIICQKLVPKIGGGMAMVYEIMKVNDAIASIISHSDINQLANVIQTSRQEGMVSFDQSLVDLVKKRKISRQDALENSSSKKKLENMLR